MPMNELGLRRLKAFRRSVLNTLVIIRSKKTFFAIPSGSNVPEHTAEWHDLQNVVDAVRDCSIKRDKVCAPYEYMVAMAVNYAFNGLRSLIGSDRKLSTQAGMLHRLSYFLGKKDFYGYRDHDELVYFLNRLYRGVNNRISVEQSAIRHAAKKG